MFFDIINCNNEGIKMQIRTENVNETIRIGRLLAGIMEDNTCIYLIGEMASGKTHFARGVAEGLGLGSQVCSPTFAIINRYENEDCVLNHMDAYRIEDAEELEYLGFEELYTKERMIIEWADLIWDALEDTGLVIRIKKEDGPDSRIIDIRAYPDSTHILTKLEEKINEHDTFN